MAKEKRLEAMVKEANLRGEPYIIAGKELPPGQWVKVNEIEAELIGHAGDLVKIREAKS